ncbi:MAG: M48 family metalloprotease [Gemmatimonadetes bacterium]|nr:M48 family metalloprotease [Gemmatimonadota bacterium]MYG84743.1 M48 family metalloprotease [Gemmatimonadota bacterium]MYJ88752.1 M48 family metalloprotease [Gemmatimonadota bacterium]
MRSRSLPRRAANRLARLARFLSIRTAANHLARMARIARSLSIRTAAAPIAILLLTTLGCGSVFQNVNVLSEADEIALGRQFSREIEREIKLYQDPEVVRYVDGLCQALVLHSKRSNIPYYIKVVDTDEVNAFALPGGFLYVNRGLISISETEAELAGVIAHEIAHVVARHGAKALTRQLGLEIMLGMISGRNPTGVQRIAAQLAGIGGILSMLHHSREAEREADTLAVVNLRVAGYDPEGLTGFFEKLLEINDRDPGTLATMFTTHPPSRERIENTREQAAALPVLEGLITDSERFRQIKDMLPPLEKNPLEKVKAE